MQLRYNASRARRLVNGNRRTGGYRGLVDIHNLDLCFCDRRKRSAPTACGVSIIARAKLERVQSLLPADSGSELYGQIGAVLGSGTEPTFFA